MAFAPGSNDTAAGWTNVTAKVEIAVNLVVGVTTSRFLNVRQTYEFIINVLVYAHIRIAVSNIQALGAAMAYVVAEVLCFNIQARKMGSQADADTKIIDDITAYFPFSTRQITQAQLAAAYDAKEAALPRDAAGAPTAQLPVPRFQAHESPNITTINHADFIMELLRYIWYEARSDDVSRRTLALTIYVIFVSSIAKMGTVSRGWLNKVFTQIRNELTMTMNDLTAEAIKTCWFAIGTIVKSVPAEIATAVQNWDDIIPQQALRVRLIIQQSRYTGVTSAYTVYKAIKAYPLFNWALVDHLVHAEFEAAIKAIKAIDDNPYIGYDDTKMAVIKATNYPTVAWVAKTLLVEVGGDLALNNARCFTNAPQFGNQLQAAITAFATQAGHVGNIPVETESQADDYIREINHITLG